MSTLDSIVDYSPPDCSQQNLRNFKARVTEISSCLTPFLLPLNLVDDDFRFLVGVRVPMMFCFYLLSTASATKKHCNISMRHETAMASTFLFIIFFFHFSRHIYIINASHYLSFGIRRIIAKLKLKTISRACRHLFAITMEQIVPYQITDN